MEKVATPNVSGADSGALGGENDLDALAAALAGLSPADRAKLAALLVQTNKPVG